MGAVSTAAELAARITHDDARFIFHPWSTQGKASRLSVAHAEGCYFWDYDGRRYLDFASQLVSTNLGHQHPALVRAIQDQASQLCTLAPIFASAPRSELARRLSGITPGDLRMSFFTSGGAEANENAIRLARLATGRQKIVARYRSYHGATAGALSITGESRRWASEPGMPGVVRMLDPYTYRCPAGHPDPCPVCTGGPHLEEILAYEDANSVAAVILEPITGANGVIVPPDSYLPSIREVCDKYGILLVFDEVLTGFGRTGTWFACDRWGVVPDIMTVAKGINSGYVPLGAMVVSDRLAHWASQNVFWGGLTYSGHPLACASAVACIDAMIAENVVENASLLEPVCLRHLRELEERHPSVGDVRGAGLLWAIELVRNRQTKEPLVPYGDRRESATFLKDLVSAALSRGLHVIGHGTCLLVAPPLIITDEDLVAGFRVLDEILELSDARATDGVR